MATVKISIIGGGSAFCAGLVEAFVRAADCFSGSEICLMDIDREHLEIIWKLGARLAEAGGNLLRITRTTNLAEAIRGSDFVLTSFRPGGLPARAFDEKLPLRHGVIGQETQGPGGFFLALRTIGVVKNIVKEMDSLAPNAFLLHYANPVNIVTEAVTQNSTIKTIGLCEGPLLFSRQAAKMCGVEPDTVEIETVGVNHANWSTRFTASGQDMIPIAVEAAPKIVNDMTLSGSIRRMFRLIERFHRLPSEYLQYYYFHDEILAEQRAKPQSRAEVLMGGLDRYYQHYSEEAGKREPQIRMYRGKVDLGRFTILGDFAIHVIDAIASDKHEAFMLNVPNRGTNPGFPDDRVAEIPTIVSRKGAVPRPSAQLPPEIEGLIQELAECQYRTAMAAWNGTRRDAIRALASDPLIRSFEKAEALYNEMASAHREFLPERLH